MDYTDQLAQEVIQTHGLARTSKYRWEAKGVIPDKYFQDGFIKPKALAAAQLRKQENILAVITHPIILHSAFEDSVAFNAKLDEMLSLRRGKLTKRSRIGRPNLPMLNFSAKELTRITSHLRALAKVLREQLSLANEQPYERRQETLKELLRSQEELTVRQTVTGLDERGATRWLNYVKNVRSPLPLTDRYVVAHVFSELQDLLALITSAVNTTE